PQRPQGFVPTPARPGLNYLNIAYGVRSWLFTTDHKRIGILYLVSVTFMFVLGGLAATLIRLHLLTPRGELANDDTYNPWFSAHGIIMIFFFMVPAIPGALGNFMLPMMIGARDLAFPRVNLASWYVYMAGGILMIFVLFGGGVDTGWTFYTPYSSRSSQSNV